MNYSYRYSFVVVFAVLAMQGLAAMERDCREEDLMSLAEMLGDCQLFQTRTQVPPNSPEPMEFFEFEQKEICNSFNCLFPHCSSSYAEYSLLQEHMFAEHAIFLCLCGAYFREFKGYSDHCKSCSYLK